MKHKDNPRPEKRQEFKAQIEKYISVLKKIGVSKMVTVTNDFVSDSSQSPVKLNKKTTNNFNLYHFSWKTIF